MKRIISLFLMLALVFALCACGNSANESSSETTSEASQQTSPVTEDTEPANEQAETSGQMPSRLKCTFEDGSVGYIEDLTDTVTTEEFINQLPMDITLSDWDGREYYISCQLPYDEKDAQHTYAPGEFTYWCGGWITAYYDTDDDTVIEAGSVVIGMMDDVFLNKLKSANGVSVPVRIELDETAEASDTDVSASSVVYFTSDISEDGLKAIYEALGWEPTGNLAVKVSTGEPPASNYLRQDLIGELVSSLNGTYVECLTAYGGQRSSVAMAKQVAADHGFAPFDLLDEEGSLVLDVANYSVISQNYVGAGMADYDSMLVLSHFKGHQMAGFGGAIKNISIGLGSAEGKCWIHSGGTSRTSPWGGDQTAFTESMAEAASTVQAYYGDKIIYINVMNRLSVDCDCNGNPAEPDIHDIGILASCDPVALDQACVDLIYEAEGNESMVRRIEGRNGIHTLEHAEEIGLGNRTYELVDIDE